MTDRQRYSRRVTKEELGAPRDLDAALAAREANEAMLGLFIEYAPAALAMFDREMRYVAVSRRWLQDYGLGDRDIVGLCHYDVFPELSDRVKAIHRRGMAGEVLREEDTPFVRADGGVQWIHWEMRPWKKGDGEIGGIVIFTEDITAAKRSEATLRRMADILRATNEIGRLIAEESDGSSLLGRVCAILKETRGYDSVWAVLNDATGAARPAGQAGLGIGFEGFSRLFDSGERPPCYEAAIRYPGVAIIHDKAKDCLDCPLARGGRYGAALAQSIRHGGHDYGFIAVALPPSMTADDEEISLFNEVVEDIGLSLYAIEREEKRAKAEAALREREAEARSGSAKLEAALASMNDAVFISDTEGRFIDFNEAFATFHRFKDKESCAKTLAEYPEILDVFMADGSPAPLEMWAVPRALRGESGSNVEYSLRKKDTGESWVGSYSFAPIRGDDGGIVGSVVVVRDVTENKRSEEALRRSERLFSTVFHASPAPISISRFADGIIVDVNEAFARLCGYERAEILGRTTKDLELWESPSRASVMEELRDKRRTQGVEIRGHRKSGEQLDLIISLELVELGGETCILGIGTDITERKRSEETVARALREKEALLSELFHRTRNNMLTIVSMMSLSSSAQPDAPLGAFVEDMRQRIMAMALVHERLCLREDLSRVDLGGYIGELVEMIVSDANIGEKVRFSLAGQSVSVLFDTAIPLSLILTELISNSLRHAFPGKASGEISVRLDRSETGDIVLAYSDDGVGLPEGFALATGSGYGLQMVLSLVTQLHGSITLIPGRAAAFAIAFRDDYYDIRV
jgi:PAS domain S-box-containing protein